MQAYRFGSPRHAPRCVRVPFESAQISGVLTFTHLGGGQLSEPMFGATPLRRSALGIAAREWASQHREELLAMIAAGECRGFSAECGVVVYRVERAAEFGLVSFWSVTDCDPGWIGALSQQTVAEVVSRFLELPLQHRQRLFDVAWAQLDPEPDWDDESAVEA